MSASLLKADMRELTWKVRFYACGARPWHSNRHAHLKLIGRYRALLPLVRLVGVPCIATLWRVESLMRHRSDRPKLANRSHLTLRFTADVFTRFSSISYSICCPSLSVLSPARSTAEMWTNTSLPPACG